MVELGLIEIPCDQPVPIMPRSDYGVLRRGAVYIRRNTQNTEADQQDLARISNSSQIQSEPPSDSGRPSGAWEQLYRACDGFDPRRIYIAVLDRETSAQIRDWTAMAGIHWNIIVDFDTRTDTEGNHAVAREPLSQRQALQLSALDDSVAMTRRSTVWVAAAGLDSRPTTKPSDNWRDWNRSKVPQLERTIGDLATITEPSPATLIIFGGAPQPGGPKALGEFFPGSSYALLIFGAPSEKFAVQYARGHRKRLELSIAVVSGLAATATGPKSSPAPIIADGLQLIVFIYC